MVWQMEQWINSTGGEAGWIGATNILGIGIDNPGICLVVHAGIPRQLVNFVQESGRGGRGGAEERVDRSGSMVIVEVAEAAEVAGEKADRWKEEQAAG